MVSPQARRKPALPVAPPTLTLRPQTANRSLLPWRGSLCFSTGMHTLTHPPLYINCICITENTKPVHVILLLCSLLPSPLTFFYHLWVCRVQKKAISHVVSHHLIFCSVYSTLPVCRIRKGLPSEARVVSRILPQFLDDFFPPQDVMNKVIGEFLSNQQPYPQFMATVVYKVSGRT